jgi:hypothetical protein
LSDLCKTPRYVRSRGLPAEVEEAVFVLDVLYTVPVSCIDSLLVDPIAIDDLPTYLPTIP